jgi:hypothetical protein
VQRPSEVSSTTVRQEKFSYVIPAYGINRQMILSQKNKAAVTRPGVVARKAITNCLIRTVCWTVDSPLVALGTEYYRNNSHHKRSPLEHVPNQLDPVHVTTYSKQHFNITVPWPSKCSPLSHFCTRFPCQLNMKVLHLTVLQIVRKRYHDEGHYETYSPSQFARPSYMSLLLNHDQFVFSGIEIYEF